LYCNQYIYWLWKGVWVRVMVFNATFNNISAISSRSVLLVEETGVPRENHRPVIDKLFHIICFDPIYILMIRKARNSETFKIVHLFTSVTFNAPYFTTLVVIGTDWIGSNIWVKILKFWKTELSYTQNKKIITVSP
jgi:hypothetical protein